MSLGYNRIMRPFKDNNVIPRRSGTAIRVWQQIHNMLECVNNQFLDALNRFTNVQGVSKLLRCCKILNNFRINTL